MDLARPYCSKRLKPKEAILVQTAERGGSRLPIMDCRTFQMLPGRQNLKPFSNKPPLIMVIPQVSLESTNVYFIEPFVYQVISMLKP